jgi:hypothetical protein
MPSCLAGIDYLLWVLQFIPGINLIFGLWYGILNAGKGVATSVGSIFSGIVGGFGGGFGR